MFQIGAAYAFNNIASLNGDVIFNQVYNALEDFGHVHSDFFTK
jgi:hypothetical protein